MKKFVLKSMLFLAIMVVIDMCAGNFFQLREKVKAGTRGRINHVINRSTDDVIIMGSSRALHHYNSRILEDSLGLSVYNMGVDANGMILASGISELAFRRHEPKLIIFEMTPAYDFVTRDNVDQVKFLHYLKPYYDDAKIRNLVNEADAVEGLKMNSSLYRLNSSVVEFLEGIYTDKKLPDRGFMPSKKKLKHEPPKSPAEHNPVDSVKVNLLNSFLEGLKARGIKIVFTISPVYRNRSEDYNTMKRYLEDRGYIVLDYLEDPAFVGNKRYFSDGTHLNSLGADTLTSLVAGRLKHLYQELRDRRWESVKVR